MSGGSGAWRYWSGLIRDWLVAGVVVVAAYAAFQWIARPAPPARGPAPMFTLPALDGGEIALASFGQDPVVLNFWFSDCPPCRAEIPELAAWSRAHPETPLIGVSTDRLEPAQVRTRAAQLGITYPVAHDLSAQVASAYGVRVFPTTVVVADGEIRAVRVGAVDGRTLDALVAQASRIDQ